PHPRIWVPGVFSAETIEWAARHGYPYIALNTPLRQIDDVWGIYDNAARDAGFEPGPEHRGYFIRVHVQDTDEKAIELGREFMWMEGEFTGIGHPFWISPPGFASPTRRLAITKNANGMVPRVAKTGYDEQRSTLEIVAGNPETVIAQLRTVLERVRPSIL